MEQNLLSLAQKAVEISKRLGAADAGARASRSRTVSLEWRDGRLETVQESTSRSLSIRIYADGRFSSNATSDLRRNALESFIKKCIEMTRQLEPDPYRLLPDPSLYLHRPAEDLRLYDASVRDITPDQKRKIVKDLEDATRAVNGADKIISVSTGWEDNEGESVLVHSNGFEGTHRSTSFWISSEATVKDRDGKRPEDWAAAGARFRNDLPTPDKVGPEASQRAINFIGAKKMPSMKTTVVIENRAAGRIASVFLGGPLSAAGLQQKRSFLEGKAGMQVASARLSVTDDPFVKGGFGSRLFDGEGISSKRLPLFESGVLKNYFVDTYYGKKLGMAPTTGGQSNLQWAPGNRGRDEIVKSLKEGIFVTSFLGGNSNDTTGDFSLGIRGYLIRDGALTQPIGEMNITGNHLELWKNLAEAGNDPYLYSTSRCPSLVFEGVHVSGE